jgi:hypothetical protein
MGINIGFFKATATFSVAAGNTLGAPRRRTHKLPFTAHALR